MEELVPMKPEQQKLLHKIAMEQKIRESSLQEIVFEQERAKQEELSRKEFSDAMHRMIALLPELQQMIALELFDKNNTAADKAADQFVKLPLQEKMKRYSQAKDVFNKTALTFFGKYAFGWDNRDNWREDIIFVLLDDIRIANKIVAKPPSFSQQSYACNKDEIKAFLTVADTFKKIKFDRSPMGDPIDRMIVVRYRDACTVTNFKKKIGIKQGIGAIVLSMPCLSPLTKSVWSVFPYFFTGSILYGVDVIRDDSGIRHGIYHMIHDIKEKLGIFCWITTGLVGCNIIAGFGAQLLVHFLPFFKNERIAAGAILGTYAVMCSFYNLMHMIRVRPKIYDASKLAEVMQDPDIIIG